MTKRGVIILRVSSPKQATEEHFSLETQLKKCLEYAKANDIAIVGDMWVDSRGLPCAPGADNAYCAYVDPGVSAGKHDKRLAVKAATRYLRTTGYDVVISSRVDRFYRSGKDFWMTYTDLLKINNKIEFKTADGQLDGQAGTIVLATLLMVAEEEIKTMRARSKGGKLTKAEKMMVVEHTYPYGYRIDPLALGGLAPDPYEARWVKQMYIWCALEGKSLGQISDLLFENGVKTRKGKDRWSRNAIRRMLMQPTYKGVYISHHVGIEEGEADRTFEIPIPAIVEEWLWDCAQERRLDHAQHLRTDDKRSYLLSGMVLCAECSKPYHAETQNAITGRKNELLGYRHRFSRGHCCNAWVHGKELEFRVWSAIKEIIQNPDKLREGYELRLREEQEANTEGATSLEILSDRLASAQQRVNRLVELYEKTNMPLDEYKERRKSLDSEINGLLGEQQRIIRRLGRKPTNNDLADFEQWSQSIRQFMALGRVWKAEKREILTRLNTKIEIFRDQSLRITGWFEPITLLSESPP